ncbi:hypothetical protein C2G38_2263468, partial [Gigaspora rosea]
KVCREEIVEDLYGKEKKINNKKDNYKKLLQKYLMSVMFYLEKWSKKGKNHWNEPMLGPEDLFINLNKDVSKKILARVENKDSIFGSYNKNKIDGLEQYYQEEYFHPISYQNYTLKAQEEEATYLDIDLLGIRTLIIAPKGQSYIVSCLKVLIKP